jgi:hypothetical protein
VNQNQRRQWTDSLHRKQNTRKTKHIIEKNAWHITKEGKKKEHKKIQDFGDTKNLQHT